MFFLDLTSFSPSVRARLFPLGSLANRNLISFLFWYFPVLASQVKLFLHWQHVFVLGEVWRACWMDVCLMCGVRRLSGPPGMAPNHSSPTALKTYRRMGGAWVKGARVYCMYMHDSLWENAHRTSSKNLFPVSGFCAETGRPDLVRSHRPGALHLQLVLVCSWSVWN